MSFVIALCFILCCCPFPDDTIEFNNFNSFIRLNFRLIIVFLCFVNVYLFYFNLYN